MFTKRLFVKFMDETSLEVPHIDDISYKGSAANVSSKISYSKSQVYCSQRKRGPLKESSLLLREKMKRKHGKDYVLPVYVKDKKNEEVIRPSFFSFLDKKLTTVVKDETEPDPIEEDIYHSLLTEGPKFFSFLDKKLTTVTKDKANPHTIHLDDQQEEQITLPTDDSARNQLLVESEFMCHKCNKIYSTKNGLKYHNLSHTEQIPYLCQMCPKSFRSSSSVHRHMNAVHLKLIVHMCNVCNKAFHQKSNLDKHMVSHKGIKNFECHICLNTFFQKSHLDNHLLTHFDIKKFECDICFKKFSKQFCLDRHRSNLHQSN